MFKKVQETLHQVPKKWLVTGCAGFIGSNLIEELLKLNQTVIGLDNFSTGKQSNLDEVQSVVSSKQWERFRLITGDICALETCRTICKGVDYILHQAALGSVPRSIDDPIATNNANVTGFLHMLVAAKEADVARFVYAASSSTYGDHAGLPKVENEIGRPLSPYAVTKYVNELYAGVFGSCYGLASIGLRYFNVFGPRQDPEGAYAAVIPLWISSLLRQEPVYINGNGETSRDFCYVKNVVQANILAATTTNTESVNQIYNVAVGESTNLNELYTLLRDGLAMGNSSLKESTPRYRTFRAGDIMHSHADISKARQLLGYEPRYVIGDGLEESLEWYKKALRSEPHEKSSILEPNL